MAKANDFANVAAAGERVFRLYRDHCVAPTEDTLFGLLEASHSLNDRLKVGAELDFFDFHEFAALKCLRNFFHHQQELQHAVKFIPAAGYPVISDLAVLCLVPRKMVDAAITATAARYRPDIEHACQKVFHWYGPVVNINPAIFNFMVAVYERLTGAAIPMNGKAFLDFAASYRYEQERGLPHMIDGRLSAHAGNVDQLLRDIIAAAGQQP